MQPRVNILNKLLNQNDARIRQLGLEKAGDWGRGKGERIIFVKSLNERAYQEALYALEQAATQSMKDSRSR